MRYIKVLCLAVVFFLALVFFFQNQAVLSQDLQLTLNLFFIDAMNSIRLPFYFIILLAFAAGAILTLIFLVWDKIHTSTRLVKAKWRISTLEKHNTRLQKLTEQASEKPQAQQQAAGAKS